MMLLKWISGGIDAGFSATAAAEQRHYRHRIGVLYVLPGAIEDHALRSKGVGAAPGRMVLSSDGALRDVAPE
jgi:hypothetical protein